MPLAGTGALAKKIIKVISNEHTNDRYNLCHTEFDCQWVYGNVK